MPLGYSPPEEGRVMARLARFAEHRFVGTRDDMRFYDCDDDDQSSVIADRVAEDDLLDRKLLQAFAPDTAAEARNRGFRAP
jgi:crotonobetainyl-CoA:carnitine CoA-transferase CaiB-like acyl-CoA transferase